MMHVHKLDQEDDIDNHAKDVIAPDILIKKMPTRKRGHKDAINNLVVAAEWFRRLGTPGRHLGGKMPVATAPNIQIKKMPTCKRGHEDAIGINHHALKDVAKRLRKTSDEQKQPLNDDPIAVTLCPSTFNCQDLTVANRCCNQPRYVSARQTTNFSKLPYELLVEIAVRLRKVEDFTCFRCVSKSMHLSVKEEYFEGIRFRKSLPYLMLPVRDGNDDYIRRRQFYSLVEGESIVATLEFPVFKTSSQMYFESLGWLLKVEVDGSLSLLDPFCGFEIPVPHMHTFPGLEQLTIDKRFLLRKMVLSSRPNENKDFILMVIIGEAKDLAFWRFGDKAWNKIVVRKGLFFDVVYGGGEQFYAIGTQGLILAINLAAGHVECRTIINRDHGLRVDYVGEYQYIVKAIDGSVLVIKRFRDKKFYLTCDFEVYDIDIEKGTWKEVYSLGSMAVFLGRNSSLVVDTTDPSIGGVIKAIIFTSQMTLGIFNLFTSSLVIGGKVPEVLNMQKAGAWIVVYLISKQGILSQSIR